jgi:hypothetical protein
VWRSIVRLLLADDRLLAIHAMPLRPTFDDLLPRWEDSNG